jgi:hypothetical protein
MTLVTLHDANTGREICFSSAQIFYHRYSEPHKATIVVSVGGAFAPVRETVDEVNRLLNAAHAATLSQEGSKQ